MDEESCFLGPWAYAHGYILSSRGDLFSGGIATKWRQHVATGVSPWYRNLGKASPNGTTGRSVSR